MDYSPSNQALMFGGSMNENQPFVGFYSFNAPIYHMCWIYSYQFMNTSIQLTTVEEIIINQNNTWLGVAFRSTSFDTSGLNLYYYAKIRDGGYIYSQVGVRQVLQESTYLQYFGIMNDGSLIVVRQDTSQKGYFLILDPQWANVKQFQKIVLNYNGKFSAVVMDYTNGYAFLAGRQYNTGGYNALFIIKFSDSALSNFQGVKLGLQGHTDPSNIQMHMLSVVNPSYVVGCVDTDRISTTDFSNAYGFIVWNQDLSSWMGYYTTPTNLNSSSLKIQCIGVNSSSYQSTIMYEKIDYNAGTNHLALLNIQNISATQSASLNNAIGLQLYTMNDITIFNAQVCSYSYIANKSTNEKIKYYHLLQKILARLLFQSFEVKHKIRSPFQSGLKLRLSVLCLYHLIRVL